MPVSKTLSTATPVLVWTDLLETEAETQLRKLATLPFLFRHVAVMPDVHAGRGSTVGTVIATKGAIIPACVGVDIGCGMMAGKTNLTSVHLEGKIPRLRRSIEERIPVGFDGNKNTEAASRTPELWDRWDSLARPVSKDDRLKQKSAAQLGSLGGGNHFIEVCLDREGSVWIMLHSGSRHIGKTLADVHIQAARGAMKKLAVKLPDPDLSYLQQTSPEFEAYRHDLLWAQEYAALNREEMFRRITHIFEQLFPGLFQITTKVNCHHNYTQEEEHYGEKVWITRKGAVSAKKGELGIIPGSMGDRSYIVRGLGNPLSFMSCSHGAGRRMSRTQAKKTFTEEDLMEQTRGVDCRKDAGVLDEIPSAYKRIDEVMRHQADLVEPVAELKQVLCVKG